MAQGGVRKGAGRPRANDEIMARDMCRAALIRKYGSWEKAMDDLVASKDPILRRFVFEHAIGKPQEKVEVTNKKFTVKHEE